jgi:hypothetical protein
MPAFPEYISSLIRQMLSVDPAQRPTMAQIKRSACFMRGLGTGYVVPSPIPFIRYSEPVDPKSLTNGVLSVLRQIGYTDDSELRADLHNRKTTMAMVFFCMLTTQLDLEELPWEDAASGSDSSMDFGELRNDNDPNRPRLTNARSPVARVDWCVEAATAVGVWTKQDRLSIVGCSVWDIMAQVQVAVGDCGLRYFHRIPAQYTSEHATDCSARASSQTSSGYRQSRPGSRSIRVPRKGLTISEIDCGSCSYV